MEANRSQKTLLIVLIVIVAAIYTVNTGNSKGTWVQVNDFQLDYRPGLIKADVNVQNNTSDTKVFKAFSLHCTGPENRDVTFKVLNNQVDGDVPAEHRTPLSLKANSSADISLIAEKNVFYRSASDCQRVAVSWKIHGDKNYYGDETPVAQAQ